MKRFKEIVIDRQNNIYNNVEYLSQLMFLYMRYEKFLDDDYARNEDTFYEYFINLVERLSPFFWVVVDGETVSGFIYLDNFIGDEKNIHSGEVTLCFDKAYWGKYTKETGKLFLNFCFDVYGMKKVKALVYPQNYRVRAILRECGFEKEGHLKAETKRNNKFQDVEIFSCISK